MAPKRTNIISQLDKDQLDTLHYIYDYYSKLGMSHQDIAGIAANIFKESSFRHNSRDLSGYHGYVQMSPDMLLAVINAYGNLNPDTQLLFVYDLITGNSKVKGYTNGAGYQYGKYKTGGDAAEAFRSTFERNKAGRQQSRIDYGNQFYDYFNLRSLKQKVGQQPKPIVLQPVSTAVRQTIPAEQTRYTWTGAENEPAYVTGKPILMLQPRIQLPSLVEMMEDSEWEPPFPQLKPAYKDGKIPCYEDGSIPGLGPKKKLTPKDVKITGGEPGLETVGPMEKALLAWIGGRAITGGLSMYNRARAFKLAKEVYKRERQWNELTRDASRRWKMADADLTARNPIYSGSDDPLGWMYDTLLRPAINAYDRINQTPVGIILP